MPSGGIAPACSAETSWSPNSNGRDVRANRYRSPQTRQACLSQKLRSSETCRQRLLGGRTTNRKARLDGSFRPGIWKDIAMRLSSRLVAPSALVILSTALLFSLTGAAVSQTASSSSLPSVTVEAPKQRARPAQAERATSTARVHRAARGRSTGGTAYGKYARGSVMWKLAKLESEASSCNDGCESSFRHGKDPWVGCSESAGWYSVFSATCKDTLTHKDYVQCVETEMFIGWERQRAWWRCTGMLAGGKFRVTAQNRNRDTR
jgi:hypothetical protein